MLTKRGFRSVNRLLGDGTMTYFLTQAQKDALAPTIQL